FSNIEGGSDRYVADGLFAFGFLAKGEFRVHQIAKLVPYFHIALDQRAVFHGIRPDSPTFEAKRGSSEQTKIAIGTDLAIEPDSGEWLVQPGIGLSYVGSVVNGTDQPGGQVGAVEDGNIISPYYGFSAEARTFDWLTLRLGARQAVVLTNNNNTAAAPANNESHTSSVVNNLTFGVGIHAPTADGKSSQQQRGWKIDLNVNPAFFNNGPNLLTGNTTQNFAVDFAMVYAWN
ncbi:MAG TPA: hypothetical protein DCQ06_04435, partial [Myxococcales bacterium]|nr:hypothetical protein [Myxococcales bacterium]HAN30824.1 hypothetical protein [Myxococcales bacterium]